MTPPPPPVRPGDPPMSLEPAGPHASPARARAHRLWGGRFAAESAPALDALNRSVGTDFRLWPHDVRASMAWAVALWDAGVLTLEESQRLEMGLASVHQHLAGGALPEPGDEDVHTMIDRMLHGEVGELSGRLHTGRSRNDQVATAARLWCADAVAVLDTAVRALQETLLGQATALGDALMPAYTHLQRAQPVAAAHWLLGHFWPLERDRVRLAAAGRAAMAVLPLGSGAVAGSAYPISRVLLKESLGFAAVSPNSVDAVGDRDFVAEVLFASALLATHLSRLAEDLIVFGSSEFGFVQFGEAFTTGSSMMPQKRNPDALELVRASGGRTLGDLVALLTTLKGLPSGYSKDMQEDKRALFDAVDTLMLVLPAATGAIGELAFRRDRMQAALGSGMMATDVADYLVARGVTFREAHRAVGTLIRVADAQGLELHELPFAEFAAVHADFGIDVFESLSPRRSVERRDLTGGTGPNAVQAQLEAARAAMAPARDTPRGNGVVIGAR
jgi:argininosuccinate lyase